MTDEERAYEYYKQWQYNKIRYKRECVSSVIALAISVYFLKKFRNSVIVIAGVALVIALIVYLLTVFRKWCKMRRGIKLLENMVKDAGAENISVDHGSRTINFKNAPQFTEEKLSEFQNALSKMGLKMAVVRQKREAVNKEDTMNNDSKITLLKSTDAGYINKNNQKNSGKTDKPGTDKNQYFYQMECLDCGYRYYANGTDIWLRKCPNCQGGRP